MTVCYALYDALRRLDVEVPVRTDGDPADMRSGLLTGGNRGPNPVTGLETVDALLAGQVTMRKTISRQTCTLVTAATAALELQRRSLPAEYRMDCSDARGIKRVRLRKPKAHTIPLCPSAATDLDIQVRAPQRI
jgi:hypothetical protein